MSKVESCESCECFLENHCRRYPPTRNINKIEKNVSVEWYKYISDFPAVANDSWCREYAINLKTVDQMRTMR